MRKLLPLLFVLATLPILSSAQSLLDKAQSTTQATTGFDVKGTANAILGKLGPALALTNTQKPGVLTAVTGFLKDKSGIMGLLKTDKAAYTSKFAGLQNGLFGKLKTILTAAQYAKFLGLKPKVGDTANALSQLFY